MATGYFAPGPAAGSRSSPRLCLVNDEVSPAPTGSVREALAASLRLGLTSFGGPIAHLGYFRREYVERRRRSGLARRSPGLSCRGRAESSRLDGILSIMSGPRPAPISPQLLARERCAEIRAGTPPLNREEAGSLGAGVAGEWQIDEGEIRREFTSRRSTRPSGWPRGSPCWPRRRATTLSWRSDGAGSSSGCPPTPLAGCHATTSSWPRGSTGWPAPEGRTVRAWWAYWLTLIFGSLAWVAAARRRAIPR